MHMNRKIKVLIVEDSTVARMLLVQILSDDPQIEVIGTAKDGLDAIALLNTKSPDVILMDIHMPEMDGFETTRRIMETRPVPIVICSGSANLGEAVTSFRLMEAGAVACVEKPVGPQHTHFRERSSRLLESVKLMSEVKVVRRWPRRDPAAAKVSPAPLKRAVDLEMVGIGASTGGPPVLQMILTALPKNFPVPVLIVQHIAPGFLVGLTEWLNQTTGMKVHVAAYGMQTLPGHVYLAPDDFHLVVRPGGVLVLNKEMAVGGLRPSVGHLLQSLADVYGPRAVGVLLTGMGRDGAEALKSMRDRGAVTIVQDRETSVVYGMPGEAVALGAATHVLPAERIAGALATLAHPL
jgi:two-component system chemotaxis response regulator CheB